MTVRVIGLALQRQIAPWVACALLVLGSVAILRNLQWDNRLGAAAAVEMFAVGPIGPGESVDQTFVAPAAMLSRIDVSARLVSAPPPPALEFRLFPLDAQTRAVRAGRVSMGGLARGESLRWEFEPLADSGGRAYRLQVAVAGAPGTAIEFLVNLADPIDGGLSTNGVPTGSHIDLVMELGRRVRGADILRSIAGAGWVAATVLAVSTAGGAIAAVAAVWAFFGTRKRARSGVAAAWRQWPGPLLAGSVPLLSLGVLGWFRSAGAPEYRGEFWIAYVAVGAAPAVAVAMQSESAAAWANRQRFALAARRFGGQLRWRALALRTTGPSVLGAIARLRPRRAPDVQARIAWLILKGLVLIDGVRRLATDPSMPWLDWRTWRQLPRLVAAAALIALGLVLTDRLVWWLPSPLPWGAESEELRDSQYRNDPAFSLDRYERNDPAPILMLGSSHLANVAAQHLAQSLEHELGCRPRVNNISSGSLHPYFFSYRLESYVFPREQPRLLIMSVDEVTFTAGLNAGSTIALTLMRPHDYARFRTQFPDHPLSLGDFMSQIRAERWSGWAKLKALVRLRTTELVQMAEGNLRGVVRAQGQARSPRSVGAEDRWSQALALGAAAFAQSVKGDWDTVTASYATTPRYRMEASTVAWLGRTIDLAQEHGVAVVFVKTPKIKARTNLFGDQADYRLYEGVTAELAARHGVPVFDIEQDFQMPVTADNKLVVPSETAGAMPVFPLGNFGDASHVNEGGSLRFTQWLAGRLVAHGLVSPSLCAG